MMRKVVPLAAFALGAAGFVTSMSLAAHAAKPTVKSAFNKTVGKTVLVTPGGLTLYRYAREKGGHIRCTAGCTAAWPPLVVAAGAKPVAGAGVSQAKLGTIRRPDGRTQVTYGGWPLYRFGSDSKPGEARGQGLASAWFAVAVGGRAAPGPSTAASPASTSASTAYPAGTPSTTETASTGYGYP